ncbi:hypothetical protein AB0H70_33570, partial [Streptomyces sp. NPDC050804]
MTSIRAYHYARCAAILSSDHTAAGAAAVFDQALSNGLAAIVERAWPGQEWKREGFLKSAAELLDVIAGSAEAAGAGIYFIRLDPSNLPAFFKKFRGDDPDDLRVRVDVRTLKTSSHLVGSVDCRSWWGLLSGWCRMSCGSCSS